jgi:hypothetical protein
MLLTSATSQATLLTYTQDFHSRGNNYHLVLTADDALGTQVISSLDLASTFNPTSNIAIGISGSHHYWTEFYNSAGNIFDPLKFATASGGWSIQGSALYCESLDSGAYINS